MHMRQARFSALILARVVRFAEIINALLHIVIKERSDGRCSRSGDTWQDALAEDLFRDFLDECTTTRQNQSVDGFISSSLPILTDYDRNLLADSPPKPLGFAFPLLI